MLNGKTAVITGGSRGLGESIAYKMASLGADIVIIDVGDPALAEKVCDRCRQEYGTQAKAYSCDVSDFQAVKETVARIKADFGTVHILVNNAGITRDGLAAMMTEKAFDKVIAVNLKGAFNMIRHTAGLFIRNREGCIINIASVAGLSGNAGQCNYAASKAGLIGLTKTIVKELAPKGIRCNAIAPGFIATDMTGDQTDNPLLKAVPLGRMGEPDDIAQAVYESDIMGKVAPERFAVEFGTGIGGISTFENEHAKLTEKGPRRVSPLFVPMMIANMAAGMIAIRHDCRGSAMPTVTACASGSNAIGEAMRMIRHGYAEAVITGGAESAICASSIAGFVNMQALSTSENPDEASLPFDRRRGGFVIGEGAVALVLEEYEHAKARGAKIYGEVCGYGSTCDAHHITAPHPEGRGGAQAMADAMREAGYTENDTVYINAHGTGTPMNDAVETLAIKKALGEEAARRAYVSSTKSMTGHMLGAAGAIEALACLLALNERVIPPTINLREQDEACDLNCVPNTAVEADITLALSNSLGFGGHNACLAFRKV